MPPFPNKYNMAQNRIKSLLDESKSVSKLASISSLSLLDMNQPVNQDVTELRKPLYTHTHTHTLIHVYTYGFCLPRLVLHVGYWYHTADINWAMSLPGNFSRWFTERKWLILVKNGIWHLWYLWPIRSESNWQIQVHLEYGQQTHRCSVIPKRHTCVNHQRLQHWNVFKVQEIQTEYKQLIYIINFQKCWKSTDAFMKTCNNNFTA